MKILAVVTALLWGEVMGEKIKTTVLENGFRVVSHYSDVSNIVRIGVFVGTGSRAELESENGIAHFLEHMAFKGTKTRNAKQISEVIEQVGGNLNAMTSKEYTVYYGSVLSEHSFLLLDILQDILKNSTFSDEEIKKEREVIVQEIGRAQDNPNRIALNLFFSLAFPNQPIGRTTLGPVEKVRGFSKENFVSFIQKHYKPQNMILFASGKVNHDAICAFAEEHFGSMQKEEKEQHETAVYNGGVGSIDKPLEQAQVILGFKGHSLKAEDKEALEVYAIILGGGMSSRLFQEIREKRGLVYTIQAFSSHLSDIGVFGITAGCSPDKVQELLPASVQEMKNCLETMTDLEIEKAKNQMLVSLESKKENAFSKGLEIVFQLANFDRIIEDEEVVSRIKAVTRDSIKNAVLKVLTSDPILAVVGKDVPNIPTETELKKMIQVK